MSIQYGLLNRLRRLLDAAPVEADLLVSLPLTVESDDNVAVATIDIEPGLYMVAIGIDGDANADPGFEASFIVPVIPTPLANSHELYQGSLNFGQPATVTIGTVSGDAEPDQSDSGSRVFMARVATTLTARADASGAQVGGVLNGLTFVVTRLDQAP